MENSKIETKEIAINVRFKGEDYRSGYIVMESDKIESFLEDIKYKIVNGNPLEFESGNKIYLFTKENLRESIVSFVFFPEH